MDSTHTIMQEIDDTVNAQCNEFQIEDFSKQLNIQNSDFTIVSQNIRSIYGNLDDLQVTLTHFKFDVDLIILSECRLDSNKPLPEIKNYLSFSTTNHINRCDGVVAYVKNKHKVSVKEIMLAHASCLQISMPNLTVLGIYRSPSNTNADYFINSLNEHLNSLKSCQNIVITGDININIIHKTNGQTIERANRHSYLNMLAMHGLLPGHSLPTRGENCLDHFILKIDKNKKAASIAVLNTTITDHFMIFLKMSDIVNAHKCSKIKTVVDFGKAVATLKESNIFDLVSMNDPVALTELFVDKLRYYLLQNTITTLIPRNNRIIKPWISLGILRCIQNRNNMQRKLRSDPNNDILKLTYRRYRNHCNNLIKKLKRKYDREQIDKASKDSKKMWQAVNNITHRKQRNTQNIDLLDIKPSPQDSVNYINNYFSNIGKTLAEEIISSNLSQDSGTFTLTDSQASSFVLLETDPREVHGILMSLKTESAPGWDNISTKFLKSSHEVVVPIISHLANLCFTQGTFPPTLKKAIITPVYKGGNRDDACNYRPISVLPAVSKIIEKLINTRLINYLNKYNIISRAQYGFRQGLSTEDAVSALTSHIVEQVDSGRKCLTVFLDLKKAFDTVSVPILVHSLNNIGIRGVPLALLIDYLQDRKQCVKIGNHVSDELGVSFGVPQGSVLGPTLFLIYINNLCEMKLENGRVISYADDTALAFTGDTWESVYGNAERGLAKIAKWLNAYLLTLNTSKTKYVAFTKYNTTQPGPNYNLKIHSCDNFQLNENCSCNKITKVTDIKYLGIMIDQRLSWHLHTEMVMARTRKLIWIFKTLRHVTSKTLLNQIYVSLAQSVLVYCIPVWGGATKMKFLELERAQRSLLKVMYFRSYRFPTENLYSLSGLLTVRKLYVLHAVLKLHKTLPYDPSLDKKRRKYLVAPEVSVKSTYAKRQYIRQSASIYNKLNKLLNIFPMTYRDCKKSLMDWLKSKSYDDIETLLQTIV